MSDRLQISLSCGLCSETHEQKIPMPAGWDSRYRSVSDETAFCPEHADIAEFADSQCPGCVGGWGECPLWDSFTRAEMKLTAGNLTALESGVCPKRVNGTMMVNVTAEGATMESLE